jgi:hypothetical protein
MVKPIPPSEPVRDREIGAPVIREDLERIRKRARASRIARWVLLVLFLDLLVVANIDFNVRNRTFVNEFRHMGRTVSFSAKTAYFYQTPEGVQIVSEYGEDRTVLEERYSPFPPTEWEHLATVYAFPPYFHPDGYGLLTPCVRQREFALHVFIADQTKLLTDPKWREMYCDWLATGVAWRSPYLDEYVAGMRKGDHVETSYWWLMWVHDIGFLVLAVASVGVLFGGIVTHTKRDARRIRRGHCPHCDYDLLANFTGGCPECGWGREW